MAQRVAQRCSQSEHPAPTVHRGPRHVIGDVTVDVEFSLRVCSRTLAIPAAFSARSQPEACRYVPMDASTLVALPHLFGIPNRFLLAGVWVLCAATAAGIADEKDRSVLGFLGLGLLTGPLAIVAAVRRPSSPPPPPPGPPGGPDSPLP